MIAKSQIEQTLQSLDARYQAAASAEEANWFAKLAIIELCGWIEESMDEVIRRCSRRHLKVMANQELCEGDIIAKTYGFEYKRHFRNMLIRLLGLVAVEQLEQQIDPSIYAKMDGALSFLKPFRDSYAHTHLKRTTSINAPSLTKSKLQPVYDGLMEFDRAIRRGRWHR
jgi:hypothetical protein